MTTMLVDDLGRIPMSPYLTATLTRAADYATAQAHREVTLEHLLLALAEDPEATVVLKSSSIDLTRLTAEVSDFLGRSDDRIDPSTADTIAISADLRRILEAAAAAARQGRRREINGAIVLAAIVGDGKSTAAHLLRLQGLTFEEAIRALQRSTPAPAPLQPAPVPTQAQPPAPASPPVQAPAPAQPPPQRPVPDLGAPPPPDLTRPASTEEILASARERLQTRTIDINEVAPPEPPVPVPPPPSPLPRTNYPDLGLPQRQTAPPPHEYAEPAFEREQPPSGGRAAYRTDSSDAFSDFGDERPGAPPDVLSQSRRPPTPDATAPPGAYNAPDHARLDAPSPARAASASRRPASSGPFVGSWPLIEAGQLVENIPRRMRSGVPVVVEARIARADVKALAEGLQGGGAAFRHEVVVTKAMSVRLRAPDSGFTIENRSPETQWIESVLGLASDDFASWRWTVTPRTRGRRQLQLIVSARTVGADGMTAETALPDQMIEVKVGINYARTFGRWMGWAAAAVVGGMLARFGEDGLVILRLLAAKYLGI